MKQYRKKYLRERKLIFTKEKGSHFEFYIRKENFGSMDSFDLSFEDLYGNPPKALLITFFYLINDKIYTVKKKLSFLDSGREKNLNVPLDQKPLELIKVNIDCLPFVEAEVYMNIS